MPRRKAQIIGLAAFHTASARSGHWAAQNDRPKTASGELAHRIANNVVILSGWLSALCAIIVAMQHRKNAHKYR
jgi:hypothetical protein